MVLPMQLSTLDVQTDQHMGPLWMHIEKCQQARLNIAVSWLVELRYEAAHMTNGLHMFLDT